MKNKAKYVLPFLLLTRLAGCDKTSAGKPSNKLSEAVSSTPSATAKPTVKKKAKLTKERLSSYSKSLYFEETEYEYIDKKYTAYAIEGTATKDKMVSFVQYEGASYDDPNSPAVPEKESVKNRQRRKGLPYNDTYCLGVEDGIKLDNTYSYTQPEKITDFKYYGNPFANREVDDFEKNFKESTDDLACYSRENISTEAKWSLKYFFALDHSEMAIDSFIIYVTTDSIVSFKLNRVSAKENSTETYTYVGKLISTDETTFKDKFTSAITGTPDADLDAALTKLNTATSFKEHLEFTRSVPGADVQDVTISQDNYVTPELRKLVSGREAGKEDEEVEYAYRSSPDKYYALVEYPDKGYYCNGLEQERDIKTVSPLCFDKKGEKTYSRKSSDGVKIKATFSDYSFTFEATRAEEAYAERLGTSFPSLTDLTITLDQGSISFEGTSDLKQDGKTGASFKVKSIYTDFNSLISDIDTKDKTKLHKTCEDLKWSDRLKGSDNYSKLLEQVKGDLDAIPTPGKTLAKASVYSLKEYLGKDGDTGETGDSSSSADTASDIYFIGMPTGATSYYTGTDALHRSHIINYESIRKKAGYTTKRSERWDSLTATKGTQTISVGFDNTHNVDLRAVIIRDSAE